MRAYDYKRTAIKAARELGYREDVIERIQNAKYINEISNIMYNARRESENEKTKVA